MPRLNTGAGSSVASTGTPQSGIRAVLFACAGAGAAFCSASYGSRVPQGITAGVVREGVRVVAGILERLAQRELEVQALLVIRSVRSSCWRIAAMSVASKRTVLRLATHPAPPKLDSIQSPAGRR
jgi:hypothetical protein